MDEIDRLLAEVKFEYEERDRTEKVAKERQWQAEELKQQQLVAKEKQEQEKQAIAWLNHLDPRSDEGFWFEEFADNYSSKIEAAIDYLQALHSNARTRSQPG